MTLESFKSMENAAHYQAFVRSPSYPILRQLADEIENTFVKQLKSEKTAFSTARNLIRYEAVNEAFIEFFSTLNKRANGEG